jgi:hypothetical protein
VRDHLYAMTGQRSNVHIIEPYAACLSLLSYLCGQKDLAIQLWPKAHRRTVFLNPLAWPELGCRMAIYGLPCQGSFPARPEYQCPVAIHVLSGVFHGGWPPCCCLWPINRCQPPFLTRCGHSWIAMLTSQRMSHLTIRYRLAATTPSPFGHKAIAAKHPFGCHVHCRSANRPHLE